MNGTLTLSYEITSLEILSVKYETTFKGELTITGSINGTASFDLTVTYDGTEEPPYTICGTVGGHQIVQGTCPE
jgi:hypothetical protein